ncbi:MAG: YbaL family putative K(+) efflux transporter [Dokdonella sp.]|uniref:YbaL family putative K(+) efflux transporter n=1 Tax=Dokdonella sp. TaxID=2291710 RepID=UPI001B4B12BB|nr:YbaL family putative K(+) efflux transporter [Dokdonella sp.]MCC6441605.1 Kef family K(+) transporter [Rhodanobacteraceae bacterium]MBP6328057.1 Kef family K(+) transporter [Dokdonella sp.]MBP6330787.1 Kef family K(+) transporter [Dokdonella sp.]HNV08849.1 YbaL family putative K(+) efflux transporter [Dokdonella sp.]HPW04389.1 YbaL family putative K(+) efflux transporter [Dokdonella sp.]
MHHTSLIVMLVGGICLAYVFGMLANRLRLSPLIGYLVAGIVVGPFTPGLVADSGIAQQLSEIGVILLMFGVGLHFSIGDLWSVRKIAIPGAIFQILIATVFGMLLSWALGWEWGSGVIFGICLSVASTVVLLRALEERRLLETQRGRIAIGWLIVEDLVTVLVLVMLPPLAGLLGGTTEAGVSNDMGDVLKALLWTLGKVSMFIVLMLVVGARVIPWMLERTAAVGSRELFTLAVLAIALGVAFISTAIFDVSFALGAFLAGVMLNGSRLSHEAANDSMPMRDAFAVLFFVAVGMLFDPHVLIEQPLAIAAAFLIIIIGKSIGAWMIVRVFGYPNETALTIAVALAQIGEFSFILAGVGVSIGALSEEARNLILASAMLSMVANPMLFAALDRWIAGREPQIRASAEAQMKVTADDSLPDRALIPESNHIILVGYGRVGSRVARSLHEHGMPMVLIDTDRDHCIDARKLGIPCIFGNAVSADVVNDANITQARAMLIAISQALEAGPIIRQARELNPALAILARAHSDEEVAYLHQAGADATIMGESEIARSMCDSVESLVRLSQRLETSNRPPDPSPA